MDTFYLHLSVLFALIPSNLGIFPSFECQGHLCWCIDPATGSEVPDTRYYQSSCNYDPSLDLQCDPECVALNCGPDEICSKTPTETTCECKPTFRRINGICEPGPCQKCIAPTNDSTCPADIQPQDCDTDGTYLTSRKDFEKNMFLCVDKITGELIREEKDSRSCEDWCHKLKCGENEICSPTNPEGTAGECICNSSYTRSNEKCIPQNFFCNETSGYCWCISEGQPIPETKIESIEGDPICEPWCLELKCGVTQKCRQGSDGIKSCVCRRSSQQPDGSCSDRRWYRKSQETECNICSLTDNTCPNDLQEEDEYAHSVFCQPGVCGAGIGSSVGGCGLNEVPADCACEKTCTNSKPKCPSPCKSGCVCAKGLIRKGNLCVPPALCSQKNPPGC